MKQLVRMLCYKGEEVRSSQHYCDVVLSRLANAVTPLWRFPYQEQLQVRCMWTFLCCVAPVVLTIPLEQHPQAS